MVIRLMFRAVRLAPLLAGLLAALLSLAAVPPAAAEMAQMVAPAGTVELVSPSGEQALVAGSSALLEWRPGTGVDLPAAASDWLEWEAFLSLDGGRTYTIRITPHLDIGLRRTVWRVPPIPSRDARILLRLGDEHRETAVELPVRFVIAASPHAFRPDLARTTFVRGERARPGDPRVFAWSAGARDGGTSTEVVTRTLDMGLDEVELPHPWGATAAVQTEPPPTSPHSMVGDDEGCPLPRLPRTARSSSRPFLTLPILLLIQRWNE